MVHNPAMLFALVAVGFVVYRAASAQNLAPSPELAVPITEESPQTSGEEGIFDLDIEQLRRTPVAPLLDIPVTTVERQVSTVGKSAAAIFVITPEMIRRSGATTLVEVLRMVPGVTVGKIDENKYAVGIRGSNGRFENKLLVLIDGRVLYNDLFSGVFWDTQDTILDNIERIEVIRGPGGTLWGPNAVNGVINVITKDTKETLGAYVSSGGGNQVRAVNRARVGGYLTPDITYRIYGKQYEHNTGLQPGGTAYDDWRRGQIGFRADWTLDPCGCNKIMVQGDYVKGTSGQDLVLVGPSDRDYEVGDILLRWDRKLSEDSGCAFMTYYDRRRLNTGMFDIELDILDAEFQHFTRVNRHSLTWGLRYRRVRDQFLPLTAPSLAVLTPPSDNYELFTGFIQDKITLSEDRWWLTIGTKIGRTYFDGIQVQPSIRTLWMLDERRVAWMSVSRAIRAMNRIDEDSLALSPFGTLGTLSPLKAECLIAYELGYRAQPSKSFSWDLALFYNMYEDYLSFAPNPAPPPTLMRVNEGRGPAYGLELSWQYKTDGCWWFFGNYSFERIHIAERPELDTVIPHHSAYLAVGREFGTDLEINAIVRYVNHLTFQQVIPSYIEMDLRLAWQATRNMAVTVVGQNLLDNAHPEFPVDALGSANTESRRGVYATADWRY